MKALVVSVGLGRGVENAIAKTIRDSNPDLVVYFVSEGSKQTISKVEAILTEKYSSKIKVVEDEDDFERCYHDARNLLDELIEQHGYSPKNISVDFTSGTKPMSSGLLLAAVSFECRDISYVSGKKRDENGRVVSGTERRISISPVEIIVDNLEKRVIEFFNGYQYDSANNIIEGIKNLTSDKDILERFEKWEKLSMAYSAFDKFDHETAMKYLKSLDKKTLEELEIDCYDNKRLLHKEIECKKYCVEHIVDLLENARRRGEEGKYDDAVARLYRLIEMMAQYRLWSKYNIDTSDVDLNRIPREHRERYGKIDDKPITLPLKRSYELLETLNDDLGKDFFANKKMKALLDIRNNSILAHGIRPVKKEQFESMLKVAEEFILKHFENLDFRKARFPRIKYEKIKTTCTQS